MYYSQCDHQWKDIDYSAPGEKTTICESGCAPTCAAMVLSEWIDPAITPKETAAWALSHGYKAPRQGTYYSYFFAQFAAYGIIAEQMNGKNLRDDPDDNLHAKMVEEIKNGNYVIACMGNGLWTSRGHFVLLYAVDETTDHIYIKDPASVKPERSTNASLSRMQAEVKYYFLIRKGEKKMNNPHEWAKEDWEHYKEKGIIDGTRPQEAMTREEFTVALRRFENLLRKDTSE